MTSVFGEILDWASSQEYWEQAALLKVISGKHIEEEDIQELLGYLLEDAGIEKMKADRPLINLKKESSENGAFNTVKLNCISDLININALVEEQTLTFSPKLTTIFGRNGSGKSGYARVLGCAGFTRGDKEVLPDISILDKENIVQSAIIDVTSGEKNRKIEYEIGTPCPELSSLYVFDSTSVKVHLTGSNTFSFSPAGLSYLTDLVEVTDRVRQKLKSIIQEYEEPHQFNSLFSNKTWVSRIVDLIDEDTDLDSITQVATISNNEIQRISELDEETTRLKSIDIDAEVSVLQQKIDDLNTLLNNINETVAFLGDEKQKSICDLIDTFERLGTDARNISLQEFKAEGFNNIGSDEWQMFVAAAHSLAHLESEEISYPTIESKCLLCHQQLSKDAVDLIKALWKFIESEARQRFKEASKKLDATKRAINDLDITFFNQDKACYRTLESLNQSLHLEVKDIVVGCEKRRKSFLHMIEESCGDIEIPIIPSIPTGDFDRELEALKTKQSDFLKMDVDRTLLLLEDELDSLQHRVILSQNIEQIKTYIERKKWAREALKVSRRSTAHITRKYKQIFKRLVTDRYLELFTDIVEKLDRPLQVSLATTGRKGETYKQIVLEMGTVADYAIPEKVLSEGEKRAVALADFLTEVALDASSNTIVLDDPVTSLDLEWRETIAAILSDEAEYRQVVVFTHDLPFLYYLRRDAEEKEIDTKTHWVKRGELDDRPGYIHLDNCPALEKEYRTTARANEFYKLALDSPAAARESYLRQGLAALRSTYEAFIVFDLFGGAVNRFEERISFMRLNQAVWDKSMIQKVIDKCGYLSGFIEGHLHSDAFAEKPSVQDLLREIQEFDKLKKEHKQLKKEMLT